MKTKVFTKRMALLAIVFLLVLTTLVGCGGGQQKPTLTVGDLSTDADNAKNAEELRKIANMLTSAYAAGFDSQEALIAASRGYDMTLEGFDDSKVDSNENKGMNLDFVKKVLDKASGLAKEEYRLEASFYENINEKDVNTLIGSFKKTVALESGTGLIDGLLKGIGIVLKWITNTLCFGNYIAGICLFAIVIEILMLPFAIKQQRNSIRQAMLRPKEMAIRNKYKGRTDQVTMQKMQQEIQEFYQRENFSPYSGCLPLLIQLPIIMALYQIVMDPLHYVLGQASGISSALTTYCTSAKAAGGLGMVLGKGGNSTIEILSKFKDVSLDGLKDFAFFSNGDKVFESLSNIMGNIPNFNIGNVNFGLTPSFGSPYILLLVPVLTFVTYFLTSKINRKLMVQPASNGGVEDKQVACSNTMMDVTMPLMSTFFTFMVPALIGVYWMFRSLVSLGKQFIISRLMPLPVFTEEDYKAAAREMAGKARPVQKSERAGKVRSLHHIDDEDFDDTREKALARKAAIEEREREEQAKKAEKTPFGKAQIKETREQEKSGESEKTEENSEKKDESEDN
ncbi:MAG: membrane protein insertase YidC [Clostridia bacterium]|nr:membrane protein insertase YidC [Clostridia bacterium]